MKGGHHISSESFLCVVSEVSQYIIMPGNKNSGRRRKEVVPVLDTGCGESNEVVEKKNVGGRPRKKEIGIAIPEALVEVASPESGSTAKRRKQHIVDLRKRSSSLSNVYTESLGEPLTNFPSSKLPMKRTVLRRYRYLRSISHKMKTSEITGIITKELLKLWDDGSIPCDNYRGACKVVQRLLEKWIDASDEQRRSTSFQNDLNKLLDIRPRSLQTLSALKSHLQSSGNADWLSDYNFFKGQCLFPQKNTMSPTVDGVMQKKLKQKTVREAKNHLFAQKNAGDFTGGTSTIVRPTDTLPSSTSGVNEESILPCVPRKAAELAREKNNTLLKEDQQLATGVEVEEPEWELPPREKRRLRKRPETITLTLPAKELPTVLAKASVVTKTSVRHELKIVSTVVKAGGGDINDTSLSTSTIWRQRRCEVTSTANDIRERVKKYASSETEHDFVVLHFDGKIIQYINGDCDDRLAICISVPNHITGQFLASPAMPGGTGLAMANSLNKTVSDFGLTSKVEAFVFDTTASNTGIWKGSVSRFEKMLQKVVLWLACRHHIPELFVKHANIAVRGESTAPEDPLFAKFRKKFGYIDVDVKHVWIWPEENDCRHQRASDVLAWAERHMRNGTWAREDYRELLELTVLFLGGVVKRMQYGSFNVICSPIRKPGACHRARFMASCLYLYKIYMFQSQFLELTPEQASEVGIMVEYIALIHVPYFLQCPIAASAPRQDRDFWVDLLVYKDCFDHHSVQFEMVSSVQKNFHNHLWYLTEQLVILGLFDEHLSNEERKSMAVKLCSQAKPRNFPPAKPKFPKNLLTNDPQLDSFIGPKSWLLFEKLGANGAWLNTDPEEWVNDEEHQRMSNFIRDLKVVNDLAERCVKDIQDYKNMAKDADHRDEILTVASDHRGVFQDLRKQALR